MTATPLDPNELDGLLPDYLTTQLELNRLERDNILEAVNWAQGRKHSDILNVTFVFDLHKRMLGRVWKWAGQPRKSDKNIGVPKEQINEELAVLLGNTTYWVENNTYTWDEIATRFHHRLVAIHAFVNGNGRHARLMTDVLLIHVDQEPFSWGRKTLQGDLEAEGAVRKAYIAALQEADRHEYAKLLRFVRS